MQELIEKRLRILGKKKGWLVSQMGMTSNSFWRKAHNTSGFSYQDMIKLSNLLECTPEYLTNEFNADTQIFCVFNKLVKELSAINPDIVPRLQNIEKNMSLLGHESKYMLADGFMYVLGLIELEMKIHHRNGRID